MVIWWPFPDAEDIGVYWPPGVERVESVPAVAAGLATIGYADCGMDGSLAAGVEKVAIYASLIDGNLVPQHAAWQVEDGTWSSKLGVRGRDIVHSTPAALAAGTAGVTPYGYVVRYLSRLRQPRRCQIPPTDGNR